ncbi:uncharacterized protein [Anoplolepis gracilipes]|uniref:uncharacterized protein n=1 Tax=Anoplolepis gracilipes TaxID=354296 RepID=UPI003BA2FDDA
MTDSRNLHDGDDSDIQCRSQLTSEDNQYVMGNLNETDENRKDAITKMKHWIEESDDLCAQIVTEQANIQLQIFFKRERHVSEYGTDFTREIKKPYDVWIANTMTIIPG